MNRKTGNGIPESVRSVRSPDERKSWTLGATVKRYLKRRVSIEKEKRTASVTMSGERKLNNLSRVTAEDGHSFYEPWRLRHRNPR